MGLFERFKRRLTRTRAAISDGLSGLFRGGRPIDQGLFDELEELLYTADLGPVASEVVAELARKHSRGEIRGEEDVRAALRSSLLERLDQSGGEISLEHSPTVILVVGVNGSSRAHLESRLAPAAPESQVRAALPRAPRAGRAGTPRLLGPRRQPVRVRSCR